MARGGTGAGELRAIAGRPRLNTCRAPLLLIVISAQAGIHSFREIKMDYAPLMRGDLRVIGCADVRYSILPSQSGLRLDDEAWKAFVKSPFHTTGAHPA